MRALLLLFLICLCLKVSAQNVNGKWYGIITQMPGGYSERYEFELDLDHKRKDVWGNSRAFLTNKKVEVMIGLSGWMDKDTLRINENIRWLSKEVLPPTWMACIKSMNLGYRKEKNIEYLEGAWTGYGKEDKEPCFPGEIILTRNQNDLEKYLIQLQDSVYTIAEEPAAPPALDFSPDFRNTSIRKVTEIVVNNPNIQLRLLDYMKVDNDSVSVYLNRNRIASGIRISKRPAVVNLKLDERIELHELLLYAENLGQVPPNTSELIIIDGAKTYRLVIESDRQKTAAVYLRYRPR